MLERITPRQRPAARIRGYDRLGYRIEPAKRFPVAWAAFAVAVVALLVSACGGDGLRDADGGAASIECIEVPMDCAGSSMWCENDCSCAVPGPNGEEPNDDCVCVVRCFCELVE